MILSVCSGNICRSPIAEQLLRQRLADLPEIVLSSAGTIARAGDIMPEQAALRSRQNGGDPSGHVARQLDKALVAESGLVFAMSREHRRAVVSLLPRASRSTFTIREFARLGVGLTSADLASFGILPELPFVDRLAGLVELIASRRGLVDAPADPDEDDVVDPYRRSDAVYDLSVTQLLPAVETVAGLIHLAAGQR